MDPALSADYLEQVRRTAAARGIAIPSAEPPTQATPPGWVVPMGSAPQSGLLPEQPPMRLGAIQQAVVPATQSTPTPDIPPALRRVVVPGARSMESSIGGASADTFREAARLGAFRKAPADEDERAPDPELAAARAEDAALARSGVGVAREQRAPVAYAPAQLVRGGPQAQGWHVTQQLGAAPDAAEQERWDTLSGSAEERRREAAEIRALRDQKLAEEQARWTQEQIARDRLFVEQQAKLLADADKQQTDIDANQAFGGGLAGIGMRIGAAIAMGLGEWSSKMNGGPNTAMQIINSSIDRSIAAQKENLASRRLAREEKAMRLSNLRASYYELAKRRAEFFAARAQGPEAKARALDMAAQLDEQALEARKKAFFAAQGTTQVQTTIANVPDRYVGGGPVGGGADKMDSSLHVPGYGNARTKEEAVDLRKQAYALDKLRSNYNAMRELAQPGNMLLPGQHDKEYEAMVAENATLLPDAMGKGERWANQNRDLVDKLSGKGGMSPGKLPGKVLGWGSGLKAADALLARRQASLRSQLTPASEHTEATRSGVAPVVRYDGRTRQEATRRIDAEDDR